MWLMVALGLIFVVMYPVLLLKNPVFIIICLLTLIPIFFLTGGTLSKNKK